MDNKRMGIGLLGFGTVGAGVVEGLQKNGALIAERTGLTLEIRKIADLDLTSSRGIAVSPDLLTTDSESVVRAANVDVIVELIGGTTAARALTLAALELGKPVVTANKALLATHGAELYQAAARHGADLCFEAAVGGCIPVIRAVREGLIANRFTGIYGILNGTCNYILTRMESRQEPFETVLREAQAMGCAEADPGLDIDGHDTAHKTAVLASLIGGAPMALGEVPTVGIRHVTPEDIAAAKRLGYRIKLLAWLERDADGLQAQVCPALIPAHSMLAQVHDTYNAVMVKTDMAGDTLYYGRGAGREPTASAVIGDLVDVARNRACSCARRVPGLSGTEPPLRNRTNAEEQPGRHYLRVSHSPTDEAAAHIRAQLQEHGMVLAAATRVHCADGGPDSSAWIIDAARARPVRDMAGRLENLDGSPPHPVVMKVKEDV